MRLPPLIVTSALAIALWAAVLTILRRQRAREAADASPLAMRSQRLQRTAIIWATIGVTFFFVWLISDAAKLHWLRVLSLPAVVAFIAAGAALSGYAAWIKEP